MEFANVVIKDEQCTKDHFEVIQSIQDKPIKVEDALPKEYVGRPDDQELQILNDAMSEPTTPIGERIQEEVETSTPPKQQFTSTSLMKGPFARVKLNHLVTNILGSLNDNMCLSLKALNFITHSCYLSQVEPKKVDEALEDVGWINFMHEELHQFI